MSFSNHLNRYASDLNDTFCTNSFENSFNPGNEFLSNDNILACNYLDDHLLAKKISRLDKSFIHINARSLWKNYDDVHDLIHNTLDSKISIAAITETWINENTPLNMLKLENYNFVQTSRIGKRGGGVGFYIRKDVQFKVRTDLNHNYGSFESLFIEALFSDRNVVVGVIYRPPNSSLVTFLNDMSNLVSIINQSKKTCVFLGDFNIDILQYDSNSNGTSFVDAMFSDSFMPLITKRTRITDSSSTLIDNIYCNNVNIFTFSGILVSDVSDHFPVVCSSTCDSPDWSKNKAYVLKTNTSRVIITIGL